jgi:DNA-binding response OmpR family regulator
VVAAEGNDALWKAFMQDFDLVIMDIKMPGMSGMEVLPKIITDHPDTCVIMLTAVSDVKTAVEAMKVGAFDYLTKPFNLDDLILRVERALERRRLVLENREYQRRLETKVQQQAGQLQQYHSDSKEAPDSEPTSETQEEAAPPVTMQEPAIEIKTDADQSKSAKGLAKILTHLLGNRTSNPINDENTSEYIKVSKEQEEGQSKKVI